MPAISRLVDQVYRRALAVIRAFSHHRRLLATTVAAVVFLGLVLILWWGYHSPVGGFGPATNSSGEVIPGKTLWDWMSLLIVPATLAAAALWINRRDRRLERDEVRRRSELEREVADERWREEALQAYFDRLSSHSVSGDLSADGGSVTPMLVRAYTLALIRRLDPIRRQAVVRFLMEVGLVRASEGHPPVLNLSGAILDDVNLGGAYLPGVELSGASLLRSTLSGADLSHANLTHAKLSESRLALAILHYAKLRSCQFVGAQFLGAQLIEVDLTDADLTNCDFVGANFAGALLTRARLDGASLKSVNNLTQEQLDSTFSYRGVRDLPEGLISDLREAPNDALFGWDPDGLQRVLEMVNDPVAWTDEVLRDTQKRSRPA